MIGTHGFAEILAALVLCEEVDFRDANYGSDSVKINVDQIFRLLSPETEVRSL
jgi:hypothetical protein